MAVVYNIKGTSQTEFQVGKNGPKLVKNGNNLELQTPSGSVVASDVITDTLNVYGFNFPDPSSGNGGQFLQFDNNTLTWQTISTPATFTPIATTGTGSSQDINLPYSGLTENDVNVYVNGLKYPTSEYSITDQTLTLTTNDSGDIIEITCPTSYVSGTGSWNFPTGGTDGQVLRKASDANYDVEWSTYIPVLVYITDVSTTTYTLTVNDVYLRSTNSGSTTITVPPESSVNFPVGTQITIVRTDGACTIAAGSGVTILNSDGMSLRKAGSAATLTKVGSNSWDFAGDVVIQ